MIFGIITTVLFLLVCLRTIDKRFMKKPGLFTKIHAMAGIALMVVCIVHIVTTLPLLASRTTAVTVTGLGAALMICAAGVGAMRKRIKLHGITAGLAGLLLLLHIAFNMAGLFAYQRQVQDTVIGEIDLTGIQDGVYTGEYDVTFIYARVEVTVKDGQITGINILEHRNERGGGAEVIVNDIVEQQKIGVDTITHATNSSVVLKKAVENALQNAITH